MVAPPSDNLFIGDLPDNISEQLLRDVFSAYGTVVSIKAMPKPGRSAALVKFGSVEEASWVQENLNGNLAEGLEQPIVVQFARSSGEKGERKGGGGGDAGGAGVATWGPPAVSSTFGGVGGGGSETTDNLFIGDLPPDITEESLKDIFSSYGTVVSCKAMPKPGGDKAAGLVRFSSMDEAQWVKDNLHGNIPEGLATPVIVHYARSGSGSGAPAGGGGGSAWGKGKGAGAGAGTWGAIGQSWGGAARAAPYPTKAVKGGGKGPSGTDFRSLFLSLVGNGVIPRGRRPDENCVHIKNLPADTMDNNLYELFAPFGGIQGVKAMIKEDGSCSGVGFVDFQDANCAAVAAGALNGQLLPDGSQLGVNVKQKRKGGGKGA